MNLKHVCLSGVLLLGTAYAWIAFVAFQPKVSEVYRLYYIDQVLQDWPAETGLRYEPGETITLLNNWAHLGAGWRNPSNHGLWSANRPVSLFLDIQQPLKTSHARFSAVIDFLATDTDDRPITLSLQVNGHTAQSVAYQPSQEPTEIAFTILSAHLKQGINELKIILPENSRKTVLRFYSFELAPKLN